MGTTPLTSLYLTTLDRSPILPPQLLRAMFDAATAANDRDLMRRLIKRADAPDDLVEAFARLADPGYAGDVRSRPALPGAAHTQTRETRAEVLARALDVHNVDPRAFMDAVVAFERKPAKALRDKLRRLPASYFTPRQAELLVATLDDCERAGQLDTPVRNLIARTGKDGVERLLATVTRGWILENLVQYEVGTEPVVAALRRWLRSRVGQPFNRGYVGENAQHLLFVALIHRDPDDRSHIATQLINDAASHHGSGLLENVAKAVGFVDAFAPGRNHKQWDTSPAAPPSPATSLGDASVTVLLAAATSSDPDILTGVTHEVLQRENSTIAQCAAVLLRNAALRRTDRHELIETIAQGSFSDREGDLLQVDPIVLFPDDPVAVTQWSRKFPDETLRRHGWAPFGGPSRAPEMLGIWQDQETGPALEALLHAATDVGLTDAALRALTLYGLRVACSTPSAAGALLSDRAGQMIAETLGDRLDAWAAFHGLSETFDGTFGELLDVSAAIGH